MLTQANDFFPLDSTKDLTSKPQGGRVFFFVLVLVLNFILRMKFLKHTNNVERMSSELDCTRAEHLFRAGPLTRCVTSAGLISPSLE